MIIKFNVTHIESGEEYLDYLDKKFDNKEIVLSPNTNYILNIDYPLSTPAKFKIKSGKKGISRNKLVSLIRKYYQKVYDIEDKSIKTKAGGTFGIWGHDMGDLVLVDGSVSNKNVINLGVDS